MRSGTVKIPLFSFFLFFALGYPAFAATLLDTNQNVRDWKPTTANADEKGAQPLIVNGGEDTLGIVTYVARTSGTVAADLRLRLFTDISNDPDAAVSGWSSATFTSASINSLGPGGSTITFDLSGPSLSSGKYWIVFDRSDNGTSDDEFYYVARSLDIPLEPTLYAEFLDNGTWDVETGRNLEMVVTDTSVLSTPNAIIQPEDAETYGSYPFLVHGTCDSGTQDQLKVSHRWNNGVFYEDVATAFPVCETNDTWETDDLISDLWNGEYQTCLFDVVEGSFGDVNPTALACNDWTLDVMGNESVAPPVLGGTEQDDCDAATDITERIVCFLTRSLENILRSLFIPSASSLAQLSDIWDTVRLKPPIGYFSVMADALGDFDTGTTSLELEGVADLSEYFDPVKDILTASIWIMVGLYTFRRITDLHI